MLFKKKKRTEKPIVRTEIFVGRVIDQFLKKYPGKSYFQGNDYTVDFAAFIAEKNYVIVPKEIYDDGDYVWD